MNKKIIYVDMDGVVANTYAGYDRFTNEIKNKYTVGEACDTPELRIFKDLPVIDGAIEYVNKLANDKRFDVYFLTTVPRKNPLGYVDKSDWIAKNFPNLFGKMITSKYKNLNVGDYLIDDRLVNGTLEFSGNFLHFGSDTFPNWKTVYKFIVEEEK